MPIRPPTPRINLSKVIPWGPTDAKIWNALPADIRENYNLYPAGSNGGQIASILWRRGGDVAIVHAMKRSRGILVNRKDKESNNLLADTYGYYPYIPT